MAPKKFGASGPKDNKYFKLWRRFYEPLVMLNILGPTRGEHSPLPAPDALHRLLDNLAYICDHDKGGSATSAVGLEDARERYIFWIASNSPKHSAMSVSFLKDALNSVRVIASSPPGKRGSLQDKFIHKCVEFAKRRVKKETSLLMSDITKCTRLLKSLEDTELSAWLERFRGKEALELCRLAYQERRSHMMAAFSSRPHGDLSVTNDQQSTAVKAVIHRLGRLAHHIRAPQQIIEDISNFSCLRNLLYEFEVYSISTQCIINRPDADPDIDLYSILKRMLPNGSPLESQYKEAADDMNRRFNIVARFKEKYNDKNFKPLMHAEIQVLEHFWEKRQFFNNDGYIGCSKPACYCCHLYMQHHPARCEVPQTSRKVYLNWGLRLLPGGSQDDAYKHQRDMLNKMVEGIRKDTLDQILRKASAAPWHPDSQTGFTWYAQSLQEEKRPLQIDADVGSYASSHVSTRSFREIDEDDSDSEDGGARLY